MMLARKPTYQIGDVVVDEVAGHRGRITRLKKLGTVYWYWLAGSPQAVPECDLSLSTGEVFRRQQQ